MISEICLFIYHLGFLCLVIAFPVLLIVHGIKGVKIGISNHRLLFLCGALGVYVLSVKYYFSGTPALFNAGQEFQWWFMLVNLFLGVSSSGFALECLSPGYLYKRNIH